MVVIRVVQGLFMLGALMFAVSAVTPASAASFGGKTIVVAKSDKAKSGKPDKPPKGDKPDKPKKDDKPDKKDQDALKACKQIADPQKRDECVRNANSLKDKEKKEREAKQDKDKKEKDKKDKKQK